MRNLSIKLAILAVASAPAAGVMAKDYEAGKQKAATCVACHGEEGNKPMMPDVPRLAGQNYDYLVHALEAYKAGKRQNPLMSPMAQPLTSDEIHNLAYYFSRQKGLETKY